MNQTGQLLLVKDGEAMSSSYSISAGLINRNLLIRTLAVVTIVLYSLPPYANAQSGNDRQLIQRGSFEPLSGQEPRLADVFEPGHPCILSENCLLYTSDAADE